MSEARAEPQPAQGRPRSGRGALWLLLPAAAGVAVGVGLALRLSDEPRAIEAGRESGGALVAVGAHDPEGDRHENSESVARATDGDPATFWETETYRDFKSLKSGVGLVLDAKGGAGTLTVTSSTPGFTARVDAGENQTGPFEKVAAGQQIGPSTTFELGELEARYLVLWITDLPEGVARINEVVAQ